MYSIYNMLPSFSLALYLNYSFSTNVDLNDYLRLGYLPLTCARLIPFSAASFLASGLANTRPFLGAAGAAAAGLGVAAAGAAAWNINTNTHKSHSYLYQRS